MLDLNDHSTDQSERERVESTDQSAISLYVQNKLGREKNDDREKLQKENT